MTDMIERVARAMCEADSGGGEGMCDWVCYKPQAIAAIKAMRDAIAEAGGSTAMIDAALKGTEQ